ncbi:MAG: hypothetical protein FRX48_01362 [Lasallia pustulata]|uniref:Uncharacterized protein n=1 Tax=Lasallia pustulata TaxID=136370 RepID=A0A5M8PZS1_9LECA|nr:MAG: hypothetical protein FRX48_01362 [Lasallia pustulata]
MSLPRTSQASTQTIDVDTNPYKAQRLWPPDFDKLHPKHQFRLERRYRRRAKLKWARPRWTKAVKLTQWGAGLFVLGYGVLYMDSGREDAPFQGIRDWFHKSADSIWTATTTQPQRPNLGRISTDSPQSSGPSPRVET